MDKVLFVQNVKQACKIKGVKPTIACYDSGVGRSFINNIEARGQVPSVEKVQMLASYLGVTTSELLGEEKALPTVADEERLDQELIERLCQLSPEELEKVDAFVQGLLAAR